MTYLGMVKKIQKLKENEDYLVLVRCGVFFYAIGKDAVILTEYMGIDHICIKENVCKCAIPISRMEKFCAKLNERNISYVLYDYIPKKAYQKEQIKIIKRHIACPISETRSNLDCDKCEYYEKFKEYQMERSENFIKMLNKLNKKTNGEKRDGRY